MAINDIFQVLFEQTIRGRAMLNVFFYRATAEDVTAIEVGLGFDALVPPAMSAFQTDDVAYENIAVRNLFDVADLANVTPTTTGGLISAAATGEEPAFVAASFVSPRTRGDVRNGYKRVGGISESIPASDGFDVGDANYTDMLACAAAFSTDIEDVSEAQRAQPCIVKRVFYVNDDGEDAWRLPESEAESIVATADNWEVQRPTTQNSRKNF